MIILRGRPGADGPRPPLKLPSQPPYNRVSRDLRPRLTCMSCLLAQASRLRKMQGVDYPIGNVPINRKKNASKKT